MRVKACTTGIVYKTLRPFLVSKLIKKYHPTILNAEVIPRKDPVIFIANHRHKMDQYFIVAATSRVIHWGAKEEYFNGTDTLFGETTPLSCKLTKIFIKSIGTVCVDRDKHFKKPINEFVRYLNVGSCIGIFPEGTRNTGEEDLLSFKRGAVIIAKKTGAWLQPAAITGEFSKASNNLTVNFRKPFKVDDMSVGEANNLLYREVLAGIEENRHL